MIQVTNLLLKHGVQSLLVEDEDFFKQNITQALAIKLHETVQEVKEAVSNKLLQTQTETTNTPELQEFVNFVTNFKSGEYKFQNGSSLNITASEVKDLKNLFECLNPKNRQRMVSEIFTDGAKFKGHIEFFKKVNKVL